MDELDDGEVDEGEPVGELGKLEEGEGEKKAVAKEGKKRKVRVGRGLGVGDLVEKNESQKT